MGPSGSGKTTLLNALATQVPAKSGMKITGKSSIRLSCLYPYSRTGMRPVMALYRAGAADMLLLARALCLSHVQQDVKHLCRIARRKPCSEQDWHTPVVAVDTCCSMLTCWVSSCNLYVTRAALQVNCMSMAFSPQIQTTARPM